MIKIENLVRPNILNLQPYSTARDEFSGKEGIFLDANENPYEFPFAVREKLNRYPDPYQKELKEKLAKLKGVDAENIFIGNGSDEVIDLAFRIFCNPGIDKALTFSPTYGMYDVSAAINNVELIKIPLDQDFQIDLNKVQPHLMDSHLKLIFICSPNNPTGNLMNKNDIEFTLKRFNGIVVIDEAYIDFSTEGSLISLIEKYNNLIIAQTFSKAWGLAGARVGTAYANKEIISFYNKVKPPYNVSQNNQQTALKALENMQAFQKTKALILIERKRLEIELQKISRVKKIYPSEANFLLIEVDDADLVYSSLIAQQIITRNRNKQVKHCIRISIGTAEENNKLMNTLKKLR